MKIANGELRIAKEEIERLRKAVKRAAEICRYQRKQWDMEEPQEAAWHKECVYFENLLTTRAVKGPRCYLRGLTPLGLFNTVWGCLFNRVLVKVRDAKTNATVKWHWDTATSWPPQA